MAAIYLERIQDDRLAEIGAAIVAAHQLQFSEILRVHSTTLCVLDVRVYDVYRYWMGATFNCAAGSSSIMEVWRLAPLEIGTLISFLMSGRQATDYARDLVSIGISAADVARLMSKSFGNLTSEDENEIVRCHEFWQSVHANRLEFQAQSLLGVRR